MKLAFFVLTFYLVTGALLWWLHAVPEAERLAGRRRASADEIKASPPPSLAMAGGSHWKAPLGLLILDTSGSMERWDKNFSQALASEIFAYFFARLCPQECDAGQLDRAHVAMIVFPGSERRKDADTLSWQGAGAAPKSWMPVCAAGRQDADSIAATLQGFSDAASKWTGRPGMRDPRNGNDTPHAAAAASADRLIDQYRAEHGSDANIFAVYFTDEPIPTDNRGSGLRHLEFKPMQGIQLAGGGAAFGLAAKAPGIFVKHFLGANETALDMASNFLMGLELQPKDVTADFKSGYRLDEASGLQPLVISGGKWKSAPLLVASNGHRIQTRGWGDTFYTMIDPSSPELAGAATLAFENPPGDNVKVVLFQRGVWKLRVEPYQQSLLDGARPPHVLVEFTGPPRSTDTILQSAALLDQRGEKILGIPLARTGPNQWGGLIAGHEKLRDNSDYVVSWQSPSGKELTYPLQILREFDVRFIDSRNNMTGSRVDGWTLLPESD